MDDSDAELPGPAAAEEVGDAFSLVANEARMDILLALWEAERPLSFSELRARIGMRDSGQFNYHLDKLVGPFVRKEAVEDPDATSDEGYTLQHAGIDLLGAVYSGSLTRNVSVEGVPVDGDCFDCGGTLVASYEDERGRIACEACELPIVGFGVPPALVEDRAADRLPRLFDDWIRSELERAARGICSLCTGPAVPSIDASPTESWEEVDNLAAVFACERCGFDLQTPVGSLYLSHPAVAAFHLDHGVDLSTTPLWDLEWLFEPHVDVHAVDPPSLSVHVDLGGERLTLDVDEDLRVTGTERTDR